MLYILNQNVFSYVAMHLFPSEFNQNAPQESCT